MKTSITEFITARLSTVACLMTVIWPACLAGQTAAPPPEADPQAVVAIQSAPTPAAEAPPAPDTTAPQPLAAVAPAIAGDARAETAASPGEDSRHVVEIKIDDALTESNATAAAGSSSNLITVTLDQVPLQDVVRMFTRISGANIIATASNLQGTVTVNLQDVEWRPALTAILDMHNLTLIEKTPGSAVYSIVPKAVGEPEALTLSTFPLKYASVSNVVPLLAPLIAAGGTVSPYPALNSLVVRSTAANLGEIRQVIETLDKPRQQVFIEAKFMELNDEAIKDLGIDWSVLQGYAVGAGGLQWGITENRQWNKTRSDKVSQWDKRQNLDQVNQRYDLNGVPYEETETTYIESPPGSQVYVPQTKITPTRTVTDTIDLGKNITSDSDKSFQKQVTDIRTAVLTAQDFKLVLSALKQLSGVSIISNPKIIVANEETATIHIGNRERPFVSSVTPGQQGIAPVVTYNPGEPVDFGVKVRVTPTVNTEEHISVRIEPELTRFVKDAVAPNGQTYPIIATKTIRTTFSLGSGRTAAIGGLTETDERDITTSIPLLGDIPLIGKYLFSHTHKQKTQAETVIFVTVGLANPADITREIGLPEDTDLAIRQLQKKDAQKQLAPKDSKPPAVGEASKR